MNEKEIIDRICDEVSHLFPKACSCGVVFANFSEFIDRTDVPFHAADCNFMIMDFSDIYELLALRNCKRCHSTLALPCAVDQNFKKELVKFVEKIANDEGVSPQRAAGILRDKILKRFNDKENKK